MPPKCIQNGMKYTIFLVTMFSRNEDVMVFSSFSLSGKRNDEITLFKRMSAIVNAKLAPENCFKNAQYECSKKQSYYSNSE